MQRLMRDSASNRAATLELPTHLVALAHGTANEAPLQAELARVLDEELLDDARATPAFQRLLELRPRKARGDGIEQATHEAVPVRDGKDTRGEKNRRVRSEEAPRRWL